MRPTRDRVLTALALTAIVCVSVVLGGLAAGYRPVVIQTGSMGPTAPPRSLIIAAPRDAAEIDVGDIVVMRRPGATPVTHRVIEIEGTNATRFAITQGDANEAPDAAPYPLEGEELVARWIRPGLGGFIQLVFQPGIALAILGLATLALAFQSLRSIWSKPAKRPPQQEPAATSVRASPTGKKLSRKPLVAALFPLTALMTTGVAWALFASAETVASNDFTTAACFDAQLGSVQSGQTLHAVDGTVSTPITPVDPTSSFVLASERSASGEPADSLVQVQLGAGGATVELERATDSGAPPVVTVQWSVVEYSCGVTVQRGTASGNATAQLDIAIAAVDQTSSFVLTSSSPNGSDTDYDSDDHHIAELTSSTNLRVRTAGSALSLNRMVAWQVVSFTDPADAVVQTVTATLGAATTSTNIPIPSPADPSTTFLIASGTTSATGPAVGQRQIRSHLADASTVNVSRAVAGSAMDVSVQVITLKDGSSVRHGTVDFTSGQPVRTIDIEAVDLARSTALSTVATPGIASGGQTDHVANDVAGEASATFDLTAADTVTIQRDSTASNASFGWQVIEWAGPQWWNPNYTFRQRIDVDTTSAAAPDQYTLPFTIDHAALVTLDLAQASGDDVRVLRWDGATWTELDRILDDGAVWNSVNTTLLFRTTDAIAAAGTSTYWLYFGNSTPALAFADPENVWLLTEDFESGTLGDFEDRTVGSAWYSADPWTRRIPITVPAGRVSGPLADFPLLVSMTVADLGSNAQADASDIRFTAADGSTSLAHEIESWNSVTGQLTAWVKVPTVNSASATTIYAYYGAADAPSQDDIRATWSTSFEAAWHLNRDPSGIAPQVDDSTVGNHDGLASGAMTSGDLVPGLIGGAVDFDGTDDMFETDPFDVPAAALTVSGWVQLDTYTNGARVVTKATSPLTPIFELSVTSSGELRGRLSLDGSTRELISPTGAVTLGAWHHLASSWDGTAIRLYVDGGEVATFAAAGVLDTNPAMPVTIGGIASGNRQLDGTIDEVRIELVSRTAPWINALESNQRNPAAFLTIGGVESGTYFAQGTWTARKPVVVDADLVSVDATDFQLLVEVIDPQLQTTATASGNDLVFTDADGTTRLDHVIESWDNATGTITAWVHVPLLSSTVDTELFLYYGNAAALDQQDPRAVFGPLADLTFLGAS